MIDAGRFTIAVFQDALWARRGVEALLRHGFDAGSLTIIALESASTTPLMSLLPGPAAASLELGPLGRALAKGPLVAALQGNDDGLTSIGLGGTIRRAGFQQHDGYIFETLTGRGGILVAVLSEPRAADALATFHAYGGGNAAIGAWTGRV